MNTATSSKQHWSIIAGVLAAALLSLLFYLVQNGRILQTSLIGVAPSNYPVTITTDQDVYTVDGNGRDANVLIRTTGATAQKPLLGMKLVLSGVPSYLTNPQFTSSIAGSSSRFNQVGDKYVLTLYGIRVQSASDLGTLSFTTIGTSFPPATVQLVADPASDPRLVSEIAGSDPAVSNGAYLTYALPTPTEFFRVQGPNTNQNSGNTNVNGVVGNDAKFIRQTVPTTMMAGSQQEVSVTYRNTGTTVWDKIGTPGDYGKAYRIKSWDPPDNLTWGVNYVPIPTAPINPEEETTFTFTITAPTTPGDYSFQWGMNQGLVGWFGELSQRQVITVTPSQTGNDAQFVSQDVPLTMTAGQITAVNVTFKNTGTTVWDKVGTPGDYGQAYRIKSVKPQYDSIFWGVNYVPIARAPINPQENATFLFDVIAPSTPGVYEFQWQMNQGLVGWFGEESENLFITVLPAGNGNSNGGNTNVNGTNNNTNSGNTNTNNHFIPQNIVATADPYSSNIFVRWDPVPTTQVTGYKVYRSDCPGPTGRCGDPIYIGSTNGAVVYLDTQTTPGNWYVYWVSSIVRGEESALGGPSNRVQAGQNGTGSISANRLILPYSFPGVIELQVTGLTGRLTWTSSDPSLVHVDAEGNVSVADTASQDGGVSFVSVQDGTSNYGSLVVVVWPRGDTEGNFTVDARDQNNVAVGWSVP